MSKQYRYKIKQIISIMQIEQRDTIHIPLLANFILNYACGCLLSSNTE
jgi:hypothetical protein